MSAIPASPRSIPPSSATQPAEVPTTPSVLDRDALLTADGLAARWSCSRAYIYKLMAEQALPSIRLGRSRRFRVGDVDEWLRALATPEESR